MRTLNPDGREAEMCGNGVRCAARWLDEAGEGGRIDFTTAAGTVRTRVVVRHPEYLVEVEMPSPRVTAIAFESFENAYRVDLGNPHLVVFVPSIDHVDLEPMAARAQRDRRFPAGVNVHVATALDGALRMRHWERGAGATMACGTGAVAAAAAAIAYRGLSSPLEVRVPGGRLVVEWNASGAARLTGPAVRVFDTEIRADP
ncbi:MAG: diaminopimelate epimerase [Candidatus Eremiobacteraeota bacterium]|nr:diaminopimelate epimerase [Candidatus Eremiobacteraeota bacterium]